MPKELHDIFPLYMNRNLDNICMNVNLRVLDQDGRNIIK